MRPGLAHALSAPARRPLLTVGVAVLVALLAGLSTSRLRPDPSPLTSLFPPNQPAAKALIKVLTDFPSAGELLVFASIPDNSLDHGPQPEKLLAFADRFQKEVASDPRSADLVTAVRYRIDDELQDFAKKVVGPYGIFYLDDAGFEAARRRLTLPEMVEQLHRDEAMLAAPGPAASALAKEFLRDPLRLLEFLNAKRFAARPAKTYQNGGAFLSADGRGLLIRVTGKHPPGDLAFCGRITAYVTEAAQKANPDDLALEFSGAYPIAAQSQKSIRADSIDSVVGSVVGLALLFALMFRRSPPLFAAAFAPVALGILCGFGAYALFRRDVTPLTAVIGAVLAGIGIDYTIFYLVHYQERRGAGAAPADAARDSIAAIGPALIAAWVTSVTGFVAVSFTSVPALRDFAVVGSLGLAGALLCTVFVLPALLAIPSLIKGHRGDAEGAEKRGRVLTRQGRQESQDAKEGKTKKI